VHGSGPDTPDVTDTDYVGIFSTDYTSNIWGLDNTVYDMAGAGMSVATNTSNTIRNENIFYGRNHIYDTWAVGIAAKGVSNAVYSENLIHDIEFTTWSQAKGIGCQYGVHSIWIIFNTVYNCDYGFRVGGGNSGMTSHIYVIGNEFYNIQAEPGGSYGGGGYGPAAIGIWAGSHRYVYNNTIYNCVAGVLFPSANTDTDVSNNIIEETSGYEIRIDVEDASIDIKNNILYNSGGSETIYRNGDKSVATYNSTYSGSGNINADPEMTDPATADFTLLAGGNSVDAGLAPGALAVNPYTVFESANGVGVAYDITGLARPDNSAWDIGAYEYNSANPPPTGITLNATTLNATTLNIE
jgi:hypothetical protein